MKTSLGHHQPELDDQQTLLGEHGHALPLHPHTASSHAPQNQPALFGGSALAIQPVPSDEDVFEDVQVRTDAEEVLRILDGDQAGDFSGQLDF